MVLSHYHDIHGHFSEDITQRRLMGAYYWPTRMQDTVEFCRSCASCQFFGPRKPSQTVLPMLHLQPMDMLGMDYLGPITPTPESGNRNILVIVDYFSRHCWARAVKANSGAEAVRGITDLSRTFGWPRSLYTDNGTHFAQGALPVLMKEVRVRHFPTPKTHPQSVGLSERYVQLITFSLRTFLDQYPSAIRTWDVFLGRIVHALNCRIIKVMGYTPSQLLIGFNPVRQIWDLDPKATLYRDELESYVQKVLEGAHPLPSISDPELRVATLDEVRQTALDCLFKSNRSIIRREARKKRWGEPKDGDLVLLRRFAADQYHGRKLEP